MSTRRWATSQLAIGAIIAIMSAGLMGYAMKSGTPLRFGDERQYVEIATNVATGKGFSLYGNATAYRPPAWPLVLALALFLGLPTGLLSLLSAASLVCAAVIAAFLGCKLSRSHWGGLAGIAILAYPLNIYTALTVYPQSFATLLLLVLWLVATQLIDPPLTTSPRRVTALYLLLGFVASLLALSVPVLAFSGAATVIAVIAMNPRNRWAGITVLPALLTPIAAWTVRNYFALGHAVPISTSTGVNLLIGNNANATGSSGLAANIDGARQSAAALANEVDRDTYLRGQAVNWVVEHPMDAIVLYFAKVLNYFSPYNDPVTNSAGGHAQRLIAYLCFCLLIILVAARFLVRDRVPLSRSEWLFLALFLVNAPVMAVFFTRVRFRLPLDGVLIVEAAISIAAIVVLTLARRSHVPTNGQVAARLHEEL